jgi:type II secretory pathway pseudopilin PulG
MKKLNTNQIGFAHLALIGIILGVAIVGFAAGNVYTTQQKRKEAARQEALQKEKVAKELEAKTIADTEKSIVNLPTTEAEQKLAPTPAPPPKTAPAPAPKPAAPTITKFTIASTSAQISADTVVLTANLGGSYAGTCEAMVKWTDGTNAQWFKETFTNNSSCTVTVPREKLAGQNTWKFYMHYYNDPKNITIKGSSGSNTFSLQ